MFQSKILREEVFLLNKVLNYFNSFPPRTFKNKEGVRQASVSMILRFDPKLFEENKVLEPPKENIPQTESGFLKFVELNDRIKPIDNSTTGIEIMFIQRATNPDDVHSGQVAFPGGKCDDQEDDYNAVIREVEEECGLDLGDSTQYAYLGKFPRNFYGYTTPKAKLYISVHMFFQLDLGDTPFRRNADEIQDIFWVPLRFFLDPDLQTFRTTEPYKIDIAARLPKGKIISPISGKLTKGLIAATYMHFDLPNNSVLWGLTLYFMIYFLKNIMNQVKENPSEFTTVVNEKALGYILENGLKHNFIYNYDAFLGFRKATLNWLYYRHRIEQFEGKEDTPKIPYIGIPLLFIVIPTVINYCSKL